MTFPTFLKRLLILWYPEAFKKKRPLDYSVVIEESMGKVKHKPEGCDTVRQYIDFVLKECRESLVDHARHITHYYILLDKGAPVPKKVFAHKKRDKVKPMENPDPNSWHPYVMPESNDGRLPFDWDRLVANRGLARREVNWLFFKAIMDPEVGIAPGPNQSVIIHGVPNARLTETMERNDKDCYNRVYFAKGMPPPAPGYPCPVIRDEWREVYNTHVREGDLATMFYAKQAIHRDNNILVSINDGDIISIALAFAPERIDPIKGTFRNKMYLHLPGSGKKSKRQLKKNAKAWEHIDVSCDYFVNVNVLYELIRTDKRFRGCNVQNPHASLISLIILCGTDFFDSYSEDGHGLFSGVGSIEHIIGTFMDNPAKYSHMVQLYYSNTYGNVNLVRNPEIDEDKFLEFVYDVYRSKHGASCIKKFGDDSRASLVKYCTQTLSNVKRRERETDDKWQKRFVKGLKRVIRDKNPESEIDFDARKKRANISRNFGESEQEFEQRLMSCLRRHDDNTTYPTVEAQDRANRIWEKRVATMQRKERESDENFERRRKTAMRKRIPPPNIIIRYARLLKWHLAYWYNEYRESAIGMFDPLEKVNGVSYYGYDMRDDGRFILSPNVSKLDIQNVSEICRQHFSRIQSLESRAAIKFKKKKKKKKKRSREEEDNNPKEQEDVIISNEEAPRKKKKKTVKLKKRKKEPIKVINMRNQHETVMYPVGGTMKDINGKTSRVAAVN